MVWNGTSYISRGQVSTDSKIWTSSAGGTGNAIAWDGSLYVSVGGSLWVDVSSDGKTWSTYLLPSSVFSNSYYAIAKSATTWVAVGTSGSIIYSTDAKTWNAAAPITIVTAGVPGGFSPQLNAVTWTGSQFVAGGESGALATSPDGVTWTVQPGPSTATIQSLASRNGLVLASSSALFTSPDGASFTWTQRASLTAYHIVYAGGQWVAQGFGATATSADGLTWTSGPAFGGSLNSLVHNGAEYVATGMDRNGVGLVLASPDGLNWTYREVTSIQKEAAISPVDGRVVSVGLADSSRTSLDSVTWDFGLLDSNYLFLDMIWAPGPKTFLGLVQVAANQYTYSSTDGKTWTPGPYAPCGYLGATLIASPTVIVNAGASLSGACLATSTDGGATWTQRISPIATAGQGTTKGFWTGSQFVLLGNTGNIATSPDGISWTTRTSGTTVSLNGGATSPTTLVVVGASGTILTSTDGGATWVPRTTGTAMGLNRVVWTGAQFYAVGNAATLLSSPDGITWAAVPTPYDSWATVFPPKTQPDFNDAVWSPVTSKLTIFGNNGLVATLP